ncbi:exonuclease V - a 5' deoxyribonuclease domain-containing protein [Hirsutella rhossiliensis]|uniref:Exonuclease V - a 5' deoxyribonuclease domain-containing protein n=1 Tax=Hirsutella rhossiliensis TaxID=111463 RepID=A0A9P8MXM5_9HYPO|nr:exonuclease V - a 5' deoxyribonuclease domain-containing protein [Hirsutella rhossiliensis]KAH0962872.1 exonuclease V - a 5' deoxyribonuclease domain-containing protein [Hirsutella rhossiliensis]
MAPAMAVPDAPDSDSDYGYDFTPEEELELIQLASEAGAVLSRGPSAKETSVAAAVDSIPDQADDKPSNGIDRRVRHAFSPSLESPEATALVRQRDTAASGKTHRPSPSAVSACANIIYPDLSRALSELGRGPDDIPPDSNAGPETTDDRSPLQRFRSFPRKPLTVSDLTSGAWCELQYWYTLTRLPGGRRTRTKAMRGGSKVHQVLEDQVHTRVKIDVVTREDGFALKLWNLVQGLRTLRETGLTRELEVWGMVDGNLVNGIIDGVSHENPNPEFEKELSSQESDPGLKQSTLTDYFPPKKDTNGAASAPKVYLTDVKTRGSVAPVSKVLLRPAKIQLLLYHRFLADMASGRLDFFAMFRRYGLNPDSVLSDAFLAQIADVHEDEFYDAPSSPTKPDNDVDDESDHGSTASSWTGDALKYRTLRELLSLVLEEIKLAFPQGQDSLGHMLRVQYIHREDARELDVHDFPVSRQALDAYLGKYMSWWRGERKAKGVDIEEAFKCRSCEFANDCSWRQSMDEERVQRVQSRMQTLRRASGA